MSESKLLRLQFQPRFTRQYELTSTVEQAVFEQERAVSKESHQFKATLKQRVLAVDEDKSGHVVSTTTPHAHPARPGQQPKTLVYEHIDARGQLLETSGQGHSSAFSFPQDAVAVGSKWEGATLGHVPNNPEPIKMTYEYRLEALEKVGNRACARISFQSQEIEFSVPTPDGKGMSKVKTSTGGSMLFSLDEGFLVSLDLVTKTFPNLGQTRMEITNRLTQDFSEAESLVQAG